MAGSVAGMAFAANDSIQMIVNGNRIDADVPPEVKNGRMLVPIRWVAEALGAHVHWDEENRTVNIDGPRIEVGMKTSTEQLTMLERYFAAETPLEAVETWAEGVKDRNGAVQFAVFSPALQQRARSSYERIHWVTGISSPYVSTYSISPKRELEGR